MIDFEIVLELLREAIENEDWEKVEEVIRMLTTDLDDPLNEYRNDADLEGEDLVW